MKKINKDLFKDIRLLYVEDDLMTQEEISFFLKKYVKELIVAKNGEEGLALFLEHNPDMIITDIQMPKMNGLEMSKKILEINPNIPIAITTAYSDSEYLMKAIELGIDKYILKPLHLSELLAVIQKGLHLECEASKYYEEYINFIIDTNPTFMFILHSNEIEYMNKKFLELLGVDSLSTLNKEFENCKELFKFENIETNKNYIDYIMENPNQDFVVSLKNKECEYLYNRKFCVNYKHFESVNKSIFVFTEFDNSKLNKIKEITLQLVKNDAILDKEILNSLNQILNLITPKGL